MFANFFFSGSSAAGQQPVANFTGTPTSGSFPLSVVFTDTSTHTPTSWLWEKNDGSGWVNFSGTPTVQNPTEIFAEGVWSVRDTATNASGSNTKTRIGYITASVPTSNLEDLSDYLFLVRPRDDAAANRLWTDLAKTTNATTAGQTVLVASAPVSPLSPAPTTVDLVKGNSTPRLQLGVDADDVTYLETIGTDPGDVPALANNTVLTPVSSGPFHGFIWFYNTPEANDIDGILESVNDIRLRTNINGSANLSYGASFVSIAPGTFASETWQLVQIYLDTGTSKVGIQANNNSPILVAATPFDIANNFQLAAFYCEAGTLFGCYGFRNVVPSPADLETVWQSGPNGDGINWPPGLVMTATLLYSGEIVECAFPTNYVLGTGSPVVTIDGLDVTCVRYFQISSDRLWIRIPPASIVTSNTAVITVTLPSGLVSLGHTTNHAVTNNTSTETLLPVTPPGNAGDIEVGNNYGSPAYFSPSTVFSNAAALLSEWQTIGATVTYGTNGLPLTISGGLGYVNALIFVDVANPTQTGNYLVRTKGGGSASLLYNVFSVGTVIASGTAGGWSYQVVTIPAGTTLSSVHAFAPLTDLQIIFPNDWNTGTHLPLTTVDSDWTEGYGQHSYMRALGWNYINNSNVRYTADFIPDGYYSQAQRTVRSASGTILSATPTTSVWIPATDVWLITHAIPGDPFRTGDVVNTGGILSLIERITSTTYKALGTPTAPTGAITFDVSQLGIPEEVGRAASELGQGLWYNVAHLMDDTSITALANKLLSTVTAGIKIRIEPSNECWNFFFTQTRYLDGLRRLNGTTLAIEYAQFSVRVHKLFLDAFTAAGRTADLVRVVAWQAFDSGLGLQVMDAYKSRCVALGYSFTAPHEYAVTDYYANSDPGVSSDPTATRFRDFLMNGSDDPVPLSATGLLDLAVDYLLDGTTGSLLGVTSSADMITQWNSDNGASVRNVTYEGGPGMDGSEQSFSGRASGDGPNYAGTNGLDGAGAMMNLAFQRANRHPRIGNAQYGAIKQCLDAGYAAWSQFSSMGGYTRFGYWPDREYFDQPIGNGDSNLADLNNIVGAEAPKLFAEQRWIAGSTEVTGIVLTTIPQDKIFQYDFGQTYSSVPLAGTYTGGFLSDVEGQALDASDDTVIVDWTSLVATIGGGNWSGSLQIPRHTRQYYVKVRAANVHVVSATGSTQFFCGGLIIGYGQSNWLGMMNGNEAPVPSANPATRQFDGFSWVTLPAANGIRELLNGLVAGSSFSWGVLSGGEGGVPIAALQSGTTPFTDLTAVIAGGGGKACAIVFRQGEGDANGLGTTESGYSDAMDTLHGSLVSLLGRTRTQCPFFISSLATVNDPAYPYWEVVQSSQVNAHLTYPNIYYTHSNVTSPMFDPIHQTGLGYGNTGKWYARGITKQLGIFSNGPAWFISAVSRVTATTLDVTVVHSMGTDFTPTSGITGFDVSSDNGASWSTAVGARQSATVIRLTHTSIVTTITVLVRYQAVKLPDVTAAVFDNGSLTAPLNHSAWQTLSASGSGSLPVPTYRNTILPTGPDATHQLNSGFSIGTASAGRLVIGTLTVASNNGAPISAVVLEPNTGSPVTATIVINAAFSATTGTVVIFQGIVPTGTTLNVRSTWPSSYSNSGVVSIWTVPSGDLSSTTPVDSDSTNGTGTSKTVNISSSSGGFIIAASTENDTNSQTVSIGGTETYVQRYGTVQSAAWHVIADASNTTTQTNANAVTATYANSNPITLAAASWR